MPEKNPHTNRISSATGLPQVLVDGTNTYLYGIGRIGEEQPGRWQYHIPDALGLVLQLSDAAGEEDILIEQEEKRSSISRLSDVLKDREGGSKTNLEFIWTQLLYHVYVVWV